MYSYCPSINEVSTEPFTYEETTEKGDYYYEEDHTKLLLSRRCIEF